MTKKSAARCEARGLINSLKKIEIAFLTVFWSYLLQHFSRSSKALQGNDADIALAICQYDSLTDLTSEMRNEADTFFEKFEAAANNLLPGVAYEERRQRRRTLRPGETRGDDDTTIDRRTTFKRNVFLPIIDNISAELEKRARGYRTIYEKFRLLEQLTALSLEDVAEKESNLEKCYPDDLEFLDNECSHLRSVLRSNSSELPASISELANFIVNRQLQGVYPNVMVTIRMFLCTMVSNCSAERSFSILKLVNNARRSTLTHQHMNALVFLCINSSILLCTDFEEIIGMFALEKARRKLLFFFDKHLVFLFYCFSVYTLC